MICLTYEKLQLGKEIVFIFVKPGVYSLRSSERGIDE